MVRLVRHGHPWSVILAPGYAGMTQPWTDLVRAFDIAPSVCSASICGE